MITRETKVGVVVASSFVCLVGIVLVSKLLQGETPAADGDATASKSLAAAPSTGPAKKAAAKAAPAVEKGTAAAKSPVPAVTPAVEPAPHTEEKAIVDPILVPPDPAPVAATTEKETAPAIVVVPVVAETAPKVEPMPLSAAEKAKNEKAVAEAKHELEVKEALMAQKKKKDGEQATAGEEKSAEEKAETTYPIHDVVPAPVDHVAAPIAIKTKPDGKKEATPVLSTTNPAQLPASIRVPTRHKDPSRGDKLPMVPAAKDPDKLPVVGAPIVADTRPIAVAPAPAKTIVPTVESFDYRTHVSGQGDTLVSISQQYYKTDKYAAALQEFNAKHPLGKGAELKDTPDVGQKVIVPDAAYLDAHYAGSIAGRAPLKIGKPEALNPSLANVGTRAAAGPAMADANVVPVAGAKDSGGPTYVVRGSSERLYFIARDTLGDANRWTEIYRLNPQIAPEQFVPEGTTIRLPPGARVGH